MKTFLVSTAFVIFAASSFAHDADETLGNPFDRSIFGLDVLVVETTLGVVKTEVLSHTECLQKAQVINWHGITVYRVPHETIKIRPTETPALPSELYSPTPITPGGVPGEFTGSTEGSEDEDGTVLI